MTTNHSSAILTYDSNDQNRTYVRQNNKPPGRSPQNASPPGKWCFAYSAMSALPPPFLFIVLIFSTLPLLAKATNPHLKSDSVELNLIFRQAVTRVEPGYRNNKANLDSFINKVTELHNNPDYRISSLDIMAYASPEGVLSQNRRLSHKRAANITAYLQERLPFMPDSLFRVHADGINWRGLEKMVDASDMRHRDEVLVILREKPEETIQDGISVQTRLNGLKRLHDGAPYRYMYRKFFPELRNVDAEMAIHYEKSLYRPLPPLADAPEAGIGLLPVPLSAGDTISAPLYRPWQRHAYIKTNLPAWLCFWTNIAGEIDLAPHWSLNLAVYYSGFDYFKRTLKFRTFTVMPEARYWFRGRNDGFFVGAHAGMAYYNIALRGDNRYQDHAGRTPALGGGASVGYRFALPRNPRWKFEAAVGYGVYRLDYDIFENRHNGPLTGRVKRTFYGIDNVAFSVCYTFNVKKKD